MKPNRGLSLVIAVAAVLLSACSYIQGWFPDKEKDYQYTTEIPPLVIPSDLTDKPALKGAAPASDEISRDESADANQAVKAPGPDTQPDEEMGAALEASGYDVQSEESESKPSEQVQPETEDQRDEQVKSEPESKVDEQATAEPYLPDESAAAVEQPAQKEEDKSDKISADLVVYDDGETRLRIGTEKATAWRVVGKALSRRSIEVVDRNQEEGSYEVHYDPDEQPFEDDSWWDEVKFIFGGVKSGDKQFLLKLIENNRQTDVAILDLDGKPSSGPAGLRLLKLIQKTINADQAK